MTEYTPTTDEVRYRVEHDWEPYSAGSFDRWLEQVKAEAWAEGYSHCFEFWSGLKLKNGQKGKSMNEYVPTTEEIRRFWSWNGKLYSMAKPINLNLAEESFDRWLEQVKAEAWAEGYSHCFDMERKGMDNVSLNDNPYRSSNG